MVDELILEVLQKDLQEVGMAGAAFAATALGYVSCLTLSCSPWLVAHSVVPRMRGSTEFTRV